MSGSVFFAAFNRQATGLIVRLDVIEKRLAQLEEEAAELGRWRKLVTSSPTDTGSLDRKSSYLEAMTTFFSDDELNTLCFQLGVDYDALPATGTHGKARELIDYLERRKKLERLYAKVKEERPFLDLE